MSEQAGGNWGKFGRILPYPITFLAILIFYLQFPFHTLSDAKWALHITSSIIHEGNVDLNEFEHQFADNSFYAIQQPASSDRWLTTFPIGSPVLAVPVVWLVEQFDPRLETNLHDHLLRTGPSDRLALWYQGVAASAIVSLSAVVMLAIARRRLDWLPALLFTATYAFGTGMFSTASRNLWQHGPSALMLALTLLLVLSAQSKHAARALFLAGIAIGLSFVMRPTNAFAVLVWSAYVLWHHRKQSAWFFAGGASVALCFFAFNWQAYGVPLTYYYLHATEPSLILANLWGLLLSPSRGLLIYSPFLLFMGYALWHNKVGATELALLLIIALNLLVLLLWLNWWGGHSYGARLLTDIVPYLLYLLLPLFAWRPTTRLGQIALGLFGVLALLSMLIHWRGVLPVTHQWNTQPLPIDDFPARNWSWRDAQMLRRRRDQPLRFFPQRIVADGEIAELTILNNSTETITWRLILPLWLDAESNNHASYIVDNDGRRWLEPSAPLLPDQTDTVRLNVPAGTHSASAALAIDSFSSDGTQLTTQIVPFASRSADTISPPTIGNLSVPIDVAITDSSTTPTTLAQIGDGWYLPESFEQFRWRWAQSPATLWIYSVRNCDSTMLLSFSELFDPAAQNWRGDNGQLVITQRNSQAQSLPVQRETPLTVPLALGVGWNLVTLELATGNYRVSELDKASADNRLLSFAANSVSVQTCP